MTSSSFKKSIRTGFGFGITSAVITTLGLIIGLKAGTQSKTAVLGGILIIAIADAFSDALGIHISEESKGNHSPKEIWTATFATFLTKFIFGLSFVFPVVFFPLNQAVIIGIILGFSYLTVFSFYLAKKQKRKPFLIVLEHLTVAVLVITISYSIGNFIKSVLSF